MTSPIEKMCNMDTAPYYRIVEYTGPIYFLAEEVNKPMDKGWAPVGGPFGHGSHWMQAMVKVSTADVIQTYADVSKS